MATVVILVAAGWFILQSPLFDVDSITVEGNGHTATADIVTIIGFGYGDPLVGVRPDAARERLLALPWIADAAVDVTWSGDAHITVRERDPVAIVVAPSGDRYLVDVTGRVLEAINPEMDGEIYRDLVVVEGVEIAFSESPARIVGARASGALEFGASLGPGVKSRVDAVIAKDDGVELRLRPTGTVLLGTTSALEAKVRSLTTVLAQVSLDDLDVIDVRVPAQPVVRRVADSVTPTATGQTSEALGND